MNRRAFLAAVFGSAVASALPSPELHLSPSAFKERYLDTAARRIAASIDARLLQVGDTFTIAGVYAVNPPTSTPIEFTAIDSYTFEFSEDELDLELAA